MAWYDVEYTCGHRDRMQIYGPTSNRQSIADREGRKDCPDCYRTKMDKRRAEESLAASCDNAAAGLPTLVGSEKQIAWAETIRSKMLAEAHLDTLYVRPGKIENHPLSGTLGDPRWESIEDAITAHRSAIRNQSSAKWWIDHREDNLRMQVIKMMTDQISTIFAPELAAAKAAIESAKRADRTAQDQARVAEVQSENLRRQLGAVAASQFVPLRVELKGRNFSVYGDDDHVALGYLDDGEWVIYQIDDLTFPSTIPEAEVLSQRVRKMVGGGSC